MSEDDKCPWCLTETETQSHTFFSCTVVRDLWAAANCEKLVRVDEFPDFKDLIEAWGSENLKTQQRGAALLWLIWERRNNKVFNNKETPHNVVLMRMANLVEDYDKYAKRIYGCKAPKAPKSPKVWKPPPQGCVKVNCDATLNIEGWVGLGVIAQNHKGEVLFAGVKRYKAFWSPKLAECKAAIYAVRLAKQHGLNNVILESDNSSIISRLSKASTYLSDLDSLLDDVLDTCSFFDFISWSHVKREGNFVAHHLARIIPYGVEQIWANCCPNDISPYVLMDNSSNNE
ncbi:uncharacterized protein LOC110701798 [Chenopodium quinoa]|uniref:uncharacterized protein LOC110701798 n=1 Tax=Chenopodium quinoa TaxID=63459 RepID=UPI000B79946C|nr:uncharacterized protein LOC110701798 [Chenopodium quinoa]